MTNCEAIKILKIERDHMTPTLFAERIEAIDMAISALQAQDLQSTCNQLATDCISRQAAIETSLEFFVEFLGGAFYKNSQKELIARFQRLPSAQPERRWIQVSERMPENRDWVLGIFQEVDTGWINPIPFICDYVEKKTPITTQDNWLLKLVDEPHPYYERLHCIAWMPLPKSYQGEGE